MNGFQNSNLTNSKILNLYLHMYVGLTEKAHFDFGKILHGVHGGGAIVVEHLRDQFLIQNRFAGCI